MKLRRVFVAAVGFYAIATITCASPIKATLKFGLAMGTSAKPQPVLIVTPYDSYKECFALGNGKLITGRLQIIIEKMTCSDTEYFYEYAVNGALVLDESGKFGLAAKHYPPSKNLLESIYKIKELYRRIGYTEGLEYIDDVEMGHWDIEPGTPINIDFAIQPTLVNKFPIRTI